MFHPFLKNLSVAEAFTKLRIPVVKDCTEHLYAQLHLFSITLLYFRYFFIDNPNVTLAYETRDI